MEHQPELEGGTEAALWEECEILNQAFVDVGSPEDMEFLNGDAEGLRSVHAALDRLEEVLAREPQNGGKILRRIANPVARVAIVEEFLLPLFDEAGALRQAMTDAECPLSDIERVSAVQEAHERYRESRACTSRKLGEGDSSHVFGDEELSRLWDARDELARPDLSERERHQLQEKLVAAQETLAERVLRVGNRNFLFVSMKDPSLAEKMTDFAATRGFGASDPEPSEKIVDVLLDGLERGEVPSELLEQLVEKHHVEMVRMNAELRERMKTEFLPAFKTTMRALIERDGLPVSMERIDGLLDGLQFRVFDMVVTPRVTTGGWYAHGVVNVSPDVYAEKAGDLKHTMFHELVHAVSARDVQHTHEKRMGLSMGDYFNWLNEAKTEEIARRCLGLPLRDARMEFEVYGLERQELNALYDLGLSREVVDRAFFDDLDPDLPKEKRLEGWRAMTKALNKMCPEGGTRRLRDIQTRLAA